MRIKLIASAIAAAAAISLAPAAAQNFYEGKTINLYVGSTAGGGFDLYSRVLARHMPKHIPGTPVMLVQNMPGAGSGKTAEYISAIAPKDGTAFGMVFPGIIVEPLLNPGKLRFDPTKFEYLGSADSGSRLCVTHRTSKIKKFEDLFQMQGAFGGSGPGSSTTDYAQMFANLTGARIKVVNGYKGSHDTVFAMERAELDGICGFDSSSFKAQKPDWFNTPESHMIVQASLEPFPELTKLGVPHIWNFVTGENRRIAEVILAQQEFHRPYIAPPGTNPQQLAILRKAFMDTLKDPAFLADAEKMKLSITPKDGPTVAALVKKMYESPRDLIDKVNKALKP
jgi:tripartite-type tricarboxylate transporter receptor subunit TctC